MKWIVDSIKNRQYYILTKEYWWICAMQTQSHWIDKITLPNGLTKSQNGSIQAINKLEKRTRVRTLRSIESYWQVWQLVSSGHASAQVLTGRVGQTADHFEFNVKLRSFSNWLVSCMFIHVKLNLFFCNRF